VSSVLPLRRALRVALASTLLSLAIEVVVALAQGALAVCLGALARFLGSGSGHAVGAAGMTPMSRVAAWVPTSLPIAGATAVAIVGLLAVAVRGGAHIVLEARETRDAAMLAAIARRRILAGALLGQRGSIGAAVTWPSEIEAAARAERSRVRAIVHLLVLAAVIAALDAALAAIVIGLLAPFALLLRPIRRKLRAVHESASRGAIETIDASRDLLEHAPLWATCGGAAVVTERVDALSREGAELAARAARGRASASMMNELLAALAIVLLVAAFGGSPRPALVAVLITLVSAYRPIRDVAESSALIDRGLRAWSSIVALGVGDADDEAPRPWRPATLRARGLAVEVGSERARNGVDFDVAPGEIVAIVGAPGTGKSALLEAIAGVRSSRGALHHGALRFDDARIGPSQRPIAWAPPSPPVLPGTLAENLSPGASTDHERIARARSVLRALGDVTIVALADDAPLGPRGRTVSSGEAQRIALARAIASEAPVLLLDEPTANLDEDGERRAINVLRDAARDRSLLLVTHRPAPLALADRVLDLSERIVGAAESERRIA
jgi:ABC-type transport system involved in cytochrome bd biosynthesis fused ATPase/permease subunit